MRNVSHPRILIVFTVDRKKKSKRLPLETKDTLHIKNNGTRGFIETS